MRMVSGMEGAMYDRARLAKSAVECHRCHTPILPGDFSYFPHASHSVLCRGCFMDKHKLHSLNLALYTRELERALACRDGGEDGLSGA